MRTTFAFFLQFVTVLSFAQLNVIDIKIDNQNADKLVLNWETSLPCSTWVATSGYGQALSNHVSINNGTQHQVTITGLQAASFHDLVFFAEAPNQNAFESQPYRVSTKSNSGGKIEIYFTGSIVNGENLQPDGIGPQAVTDAIVSVINNAENTLDVAVYNATKSVIISALVEAYLRGVKIRYVTDSETGNQALPNVPAWPFIKDPIGGGIMHHKFLVADVDNPLKTKVITGSTNWTNRSIDTDFNNLLIIQDQALAKAFTMEFNEMWGGDQATPNLTNARFGSQKINNTPSYFYINNSPVRCFFSPSDFTAEGIAEALNETQTDVEAALLIFTHNDLGDAVLEQQRLGHKVRVMIDEVDANGSEYNWLISNGVSVSAHPAFATLHHKYAVCNVADDNPNAFVLTGSHNWTFSANTINDENTLIIYNSAIAQLYHREFEARWGELVATKDLIITDVKVGPNPSKDRITMTFSEGRKFSSIQLLNALGQSVFNFEGLITDGQQIEMSVLDMPSGLYHWNIQTDYGNKVIPQMILPF